MNTQERNERVRALLEDPRAMEALTAIRTYDGAKEMSLWEIHQAVKLFNSELQCPGSTAMFDYAELEGGCYAFQIPKPNDPLHNYAVILHAPVWQMPTKLPQMEFNALLDRVSNWAGSSGFAAEAARSKPGPGYRERVIEETEEADDVGEALFLDLCRIQDERARLLLDPVHVHSAIALVVGKGAAHDAK